MSGEAHLRVADDHVDMRLALPGGRLTIVADEVRVEATDDYNIGELHTFATALRRLIHLQARGLDAFDGRRRRTVDFLGESDRTGLQVRRPPGGSLRVEGVLDDEGVSVTAWVEATPAVLADLADQVEAALGALGAG
jgi:hypothetical protein